MVEMTGRPQRAILEDMRNWKVWVSALTLVVALGCGGFGGGLSSAEVDDIYDICSTKSAEVITSFSPRGHCVAAAGWLIAAHDQGGSCDFRSIVATLHSGSRLSQSQVEKKHCQVPSAGEQLRKNITTGLLVAAILMVLAIVFVEARDRNWFRDD